MRLFPQIILSDTEEKIISDALNIPAVKKYFQLLVYNTAQDIATARRSVETTPETHLELISLDQGKLALLEVLLEFPVIAEPKT